MPNSYLRDRIFNPNLTTIKESYIMSLINISSKPLEWTADSSFSIRSIQLDISLGGLYLSVIYLFHVMIHWWIRKPPRGPNNCMFWAMIEAEGEVGYP